MNWSTFQKGLREFRRIPAFGTKVDEHRRSVVDSMVTLCCGILGIPPVRVCHYSEREVAGAKSFEAPAEACGFVRCATGDTIWLNADVPLKRLTRTIAHELRHLWQHRQPDHDKCDPDYWDEADADKFADALLTTVTCGRGMHFFEGIDPIAAARGALRGKSVQCGDHVSLRDGHLYRNEATGLDVRLRRID